MPFVFFAVNLLLFFFSEKVRRVGYDLQRICVQNIGEKNVVVNLGTNNFYDDKANLEETIENVQR